MKHLVLRSWWLVFFFVSVTACFSPQFKDGAIQCGPNDECPPGLSCFGGKCYADNPGIDAATTFPLTITLGGNMMGTVTSSPAGIDCGTDCTENFASGTMVTLTATPMAGSTFVGWSGACSGTGACTITISTAVNVTANFAVDNSLVVTLSGNGVGIVSSNPPGINCGTDCMETFTPGTMVVLTASPATGSTFDGWSGAGCSGLGTCTVTADAAKMVTAAFSLTQHALTVNKTGNGTGMVTSNPTGISCGSDCGESYPYNTVVMLTATTMTGSTFTGWSGGGCTGTGACMVTVTAATAVTANFALDTFALQVMKLGNGTGTVTSSPMGINCGSTCAFNFDYNTMVTLSATPGPGSTFTGWTGAGCTGTASCVVTMTMANAVSATFTLDSYALNATKSGNGAGTVTSNPTGIDCGMDCTQSYPYGSMVTLTEMPSTGSRFTGWSGGGCTGTGTQCIVTVNAATSVDANFTLLQYQLLVMKTGTGAGTVSGIGINCGTDCNETVDYNTVITLTATASPGSQFDGWTGGGCTGTGSCQVTMTQMQNVSATFTLNQYVLTVAKSGTGAGTVTSMPAGINCGTDCNELYDYGTMVTLTAAPATGSTFGSWTGGGCSGSTSLTCITTISAASTVTASFTINSYLLTVVQGGTGGSGTVTSNPAGINCVNGGTDCNEPYTHGTQVTLSASPASGSSFSGWSGTGISCPGTGTCVVDMTAARTVTALFAPTTVGLTVTKTGTGSGTVTSNPPGISCGATCSFNFTVGAMVTLTASPAVGSTFSNWSGGACNGSTSTTCAFTIPAGGLTVNAVFTLSTYQLSVMKNGTGTGTVTSSPPGINCGATCMASYNYNTMVTLTATPAGNAIFAGWSGGGCMGTGQCTVTMTAATTVTATFNLVQHQLTARPQGTGTGTITSNPAGINCGADCDELYNDGTMVTLTAAPGVGSTFAGWSGDCSGTQTTCNVTMSTDRNAFATFDIAYYLLTVGPNIPGAGDIVSTNEPGIDCSVGVDDCSESYPYGTMVTLKASPNIGYDFIGWSGGGCTGTGTCDVTMDMAKSVTALFQVSVYTLSVNRAGNGSGSVSSSPPGINCGLTCTHDYNYNTTVTLTASPGTGSTVSWSGCDTIFAGTCQVTMDSARSVTATFTLQTFQLSVTRSGAGTGSVSSNPPGITCGGGGSACMAPFNYGTMVVLTATPNPGSSFGGWTGACTNMSGTCTVTMTQARSVDARFNIVPPNYVFITSTMQTGNMGGLPGADAICQQRASALTPPLPGTFVAWLSTPSVNAAARLGSARGWIRPDGKPVADQISDITSGHLFYPIKLDEAGNYVPENQGYIMTGTSANGTYASSYTSCSDYMVASNSNVMGGVPSANSWMFTQYAAPMCSTPARIYCFGIDNTAVVRPPVANARRAFLSTSLFTPGPGGLMAADSKCQTDAQNAGLSGTYRALLATSMGSAISRFNTMAGTLPWARPDDALLAPSAATLADPTRTHVDTSPNSNAANDTWYGSAPIMWTGQNNLTSAGTLATTCQDWTSNNAAMTANGGGPGFTQIGPWRSSYGLACSGSYTLVCMQQ